MIAGVISPWRVYHSVTLRRPVVSKTSTYYCLVKNEIRKKNDVCCRPRDGVRASRGCLCAVLLPCSPPPLHRLSSIGPLLRTRSRCHSLPVGSPSPPSQKNETFLALTWRSDLKQKKNGLAQGELVQSAFSSLVDALTPSFFVVKSSPASRPGAVRLCRSSACGSACLRARTSRLSIAALPLMPKKTRES